MGKLRTGVMIVVVALLLSASGTASAQTGSQFFPETGFSVQGGFLAFWQAYGGYAVFGPPITGERGQMDAAGRAYKDQYFSNAVFEYHPALPAGHRIVIAPLGTLRFQTRYTGILPYQRDNLEAAGGTRARYFAATRQYLGGEFLAYWNSHQGAVTLGLPISGEMSEDNPITGVSHNVQYFENGELEWRPEFAGRGVSTVGLIPLGRLWLQHSPLPAPPAPPRIQGGPTPIPVPPTPVVVPPTPTPRPPPPIGQVLRFPGIDGRGQLEATVTAVREARMLNGDAAQGKFVTIFWQVVNLGNTTESVGSHTVALQDAHGRQFMAAAPEIQRDARVIYNRNIYFTAIAARGSDAETLTFDVPLDAANYTLVRVP
ncbi:MAG TPA: hypothetical protein VM536_06205 [Chloroflexia bacterium]|nr:hypothetical protein [Chloroflexia bacterium]